MKNKKAVDMSFSTVMTAIIVLILVYLIAKYIIYGIIVEKQISFIGAKADEITTDCDLDDYVGLSDECPCDGKTQKLEKGQKCLSFSDSKAVDNCPGLCKK